MTRFLFYVPGRTTPCGGGSVILDWVALLKKNGVSAEVVSEKPNYTYDFAESSFRPFFSAEIEKAHRAQMSRRERLELSLGGGRRAGGRSISVEESDVIVAPEFAANWLSQAFPRNRIVLLVQNPFWFKQPDYASLWDRNPFIATVSISDLCHDMSGMMGLSPCFKVPLAVDPKLFQPSEKTRTILYMPRRRPDEVSCVFNALKRRDRIAGYDLVPIDGLPIRKVGEMMGKGLVFLSFSEAEGFGLPPAEAMAAGCLVVGYTGAGRMSSLIRHGRFRSRTGIPRHLSRRSRRSLRNMNAMPQGLTPCAIVRQLRSEIVMIHANRRKSCWTFSESCRKVIDLL